jgi:hypothetical protein
MFLLLFFPTLSRTLGEELFKDHVNVLCIQSSRRVQVQILHEKAPISVFFCCPVFTIIWGSIGIAPAHESRMATYA